jgi:hypothetical protein
LLGVLLVSAVAEMKAPARRREKKFSRPPDPRADIKGKSQQDKLRYERDSGV